MKVKYFKALSIVTMYTALAVVSLLSSQTVEAKLPLFNLICQIDPETHFKVTYLKTSYTEYYEAGYTFRGTEAGAPDICDFKGTKNGIVHLLCEDQNFDRTYDIKFPTPTTGNFFEVQMMDHRSQKTEILKLCRMK